MKQFTSLLFFTFFITSSIYSQSAIQWQKCLGGSGDDFATSIQQTTDGGFIVAGYSISDDGDVSDHHFGNDFWVVRLDSTNVIQWKKSFGGSEDDEAYSIQQTIDGGYIVAGITNSFDGDVTGKKGIFGNSDFWVVKLDPNGMIEWEKALGGSSGDEAYSVQQTSDGGYIVAGGTNSNDSDVTFNNGDLDCWVVKLDNNGNIQWDKSLGGSAEDEAYSVQQTTDGGFVIAGVAQSADGDVTGHHGGITDYWIAKLNQSGTLLWQKTLGGSGFEAAGSIQETTDGGYIISGFSDSNDGDISGNHGGFTDIWIVKLDSGRNIEWQIALGGSGDDDSGNIIQTSDGGYIVTGYTGSDDGNVTGHHGFSLFYDMWVVRLNSSGVIQWEKSLGGSLDDGGSFIKQTYDGGFIIAGSAESFDGDVSGNHSLNSDYWIVKLDQTVNVNEIENSFFNFQIYPNPFSDLTKIYFTLPNTKTSIEIHDIDGRLIRKVNTKNLNTGLNKIYWDGTNENGIRVADGLYLLTIVSGNIIESKKISVMKN